MRDALRRNVTSFVVPKRVLHIGAGRREKLDDSVTTLDVDARLNPDVVFKLGDVPMPFEDNTFDVVVGIHVLEHIGQQGDTREWFRFWEELYRVTKPQGRFEFESPLYSSVWCWADPSHTRAISEEAFIFFNQDSYRISNSSISPYRIHCDWVVEHFRRVPDVNPLICHRELVSHLRGILVARKPFNPWWDNAS